jgi:hypothetical protein
MIDELAPLIESVSTGGDTTSKELQEHYSSLVSKAGALIASMDKYRLDQDPDDIRVELDASAAEDILTLFQKVYERLHLLQSPVPLGGDEDPDAAISESKSKDGVKKKQEKNAYAMGVWKRIRGKLEGLCLDAIE